MIQRALVAIAGVDRDTLKTCPATDKLWAAHLGFALCLSFIVVNRSGLSTRHRETRRHADEAARWNWIKAAANPRTAEQLKSDP